MTSKLEPGVTRDYRIGEGGLLRRCEVALHLPRLPWQLAAMLSLTWAPIVLLGLWRGNPEALAYDPQTAGGLLITLPDDKRTVLEATVAGAGLALYAVGRVEAGSGVTLR